MGEERVLGLNPPDSQWAYAQICSHVDECTYGACISIINNTNNNDNSILACTDTPI